VNPLESAWYTWLVLYHPIVIKSAQLGDKVRLASSVGNPVLWIAADACLVGLAALGAALAVSSRWRQRWRAWSDVQFSKALAIVGVCWASMMLLWFTRRITTYWYHYLTPWGVALVLLGGVVARMDRRHPKAVLAFVLLALVVFVYFAPVWAELPISASAARHRLVFPLWW
jgi:dolichyl-phosphate-mannose--protein O-mannosyl transferase